MKVIYCDYCGDLWFPNGAKITEIENGKGVQFHVCQKCHQKLFVDKKHMEITKSPKVLDLELASVNVIKSTEELLDLITGKIPSTKKLPEFLKKAPCPHCDTSIQDIIDNAKIGCGYCYEYYEEEFLPIIMLHQGGAIEHVGKLPIMLRKQKMQSDPKEYKKVLLLKFAKALELENYEEAAKINEELNRLAEKIQ